MERTCYLAVYLAGLSGLYYAAVLEFLPIVGVLAVAVDLNCNTVTIEALESGNHGCRDVVDLDGYAVLIMNYLVGDNGILCVVILKYPYVKVILLNDVLIAERQVDGD